MIQLIRMKKHVRTKGEESGTETERERERERDRDRKREREREKEQGFWIFASNF